MHALSGLLILQQESHLDPKVSYLIEPELSYLILLFWKGPTTSVISI